MTRAARGRAVAALLVVAGCGGTLHEVGREERPRLQPGEGLLALVAQTNAELQLTFCRGSGTCIDVPTLTSSQPMTVLVVPAGRWCMTRIFAGVSNGITDEALAIDHRLTADESPCFDVAAGAIAYPGDFVFTTHGPAGHVAQGWEQNVDEVRAGLRLRYPGVASMTVRASPARRPSSGGESR